MEEGGGDDHPRREYYCPGLAMLQPRRCRKENWLFTPLAACTHSSMAFCIAPGHIYIHTYTHTCIKIPIPRLCLTQFKLFKLGADGVGGQGGGCLLLWTWNKGAHLFSLVWDGGGGLAPETMRIVSYLARCKFLKLI